MLSYKCIIVSRCASSRGDIVQDTLKLSKQMSEGIC